MRIRYMVLIDKWNPLYERDEYDFMSYKDALNFYKAIALREDMPEVKLQKWTRTSVLTYAETLKRKQLLGGVVRERAYRVS